MSEKEINYERDVESIYSCSYCNYTTSKLNNYNRHLKTRKHNNCVLNKKDNILESKVEIEFYCEECDYKTYKINNYNRHLASKRHRINEIKYIKKDLNELNIYECHECLKKYKSISGYQRHKKYCKCIDDNDNNNNNNNNMNDIIVNENVVVKELKDIIIEQQCQIKKQQEQISELIPKIGNNNNNKLNINLFLNEKCKDAMCINDFVKSIQITLDNLLKTKNKGIGIALNDIINENMNKLSIYERPIHCTDKKRETLYIKNDTWEKDDNKKYTNKMLKLLQSKQLKSLELWKEAHPDYLENEELKHEYTVL